MTGPWCLHKDHDEWFEVTTYLHIASGYRVYVGMCGKIKREAVK